MKKQTKGDKKRYEIGLVVPDQHIPFNDKIYWQLLMAVGKHLKPDHLILLGDFGDFHSVSSHDKDPRVGVELAKELFEVRKHLRELKTLGAKNNVFIAGNHEYRIERFLSKQSPAMFNVLSNESLNSKDEKIEFAPVTENSPDPTKKLLALDEIGFEYIPYRSDYQLGKMFFTHDTGVAGRYAHYKAGDTYHRNVVIGHTHALGYAVEGDADGDKHVYAMLGWGGDKKAINYMHKATVTKNWSLGFGIFSHDTETGNVHLVPIPVIDYTCVVNGRMFTVD